MRITLFHPAKRRPSSGAPDLLAMQARKEARLAHYERFFGPSLVVSARIEAAPHVDVCIFGPNPLKGRDHYTLATDGLSDLPHPSAGGGGPAWEVIAYAPDPDGKAFAVGLLQRLAAALADPARDLKPGRPIPVREVDPDFPVASKARNLAILPPVREWNGFAGRRFSDGSQVRFLWTVLLSPTDARALTEDRDGLLARLGAGPLPFLVPA